MIYRLLIKQSRVFDEIAITPSGGFNVFSGVSGSGKSVLMENILALFGLKDSDCALIEGDLRAESIALENYGILSDENINLSVLKKDKIAYFINNQSISKKRVRDIFSDYIKHIGAYTMQRLDEHYVLDLLDLIVARNAPRFREILGAYRENYETFLRKNDELKKLESDEKNIIELRELAIWEIEQIERVNPRVGEYEELLSVKKNLSKKEKILEKIASVKDAVESFPTILSLLDSIEKNNEHFGEIFSEVEAIIKDEEERLLALNDEDIEGILNRLESLSRLIHKYGGIEESLAYLAKKKRDLESYENISFNKSALQSEIAALSATLQSQASEISAMRGENLPILAREIQAQCDSLMLNSAHLRLFQNDLGANGADSIDLKLGDSAIATLSAGEFNRLKLALLCIYMDYAKGSGILILDEIDANLSGSESEGVAKILAKLARDYQIFAISHQPQMPSFADNHYLVRKLENGKSEVVLLDKNGRINEVARIISGETITPKALDYARERLKHLK